MPEEQPGGEGARKAMSKVGVVGVEARGHGRHEDDRALEASGKTGSYFV